MRKLRTTLALLSVLVLLPLSTVQSQDKYWVHEDVVKPSMVVEYEAVCKDLTDNMKKHNIQEVDVLVASTADSRYLWISKIESMSDIEKPAFATLAEKMGSTAMADLFNRMDKCYDVEHNYVITLDKELSYMPDGITQTPEGQDYRKFHYLHFAPGDRQMMKEKMKAIRDMFEQKGSKTHYRVYKSGFGNRGEFYMVAVAAKDAVDYATKGMANDEAIGEDGNKMMGDLFSKLLKYEEFIGRMRPEMGYAPSN